MKGGRLIDEGGYGCVFHPGYRCASNGSTNTKNQPRTTKLINKIQSSNHTSRNEFHIGKKIKDIPQSFQYFEPILHQCPVQFQSLHEKEIQKCSILQQNRDSSSNNFVMMTMNYVKGVYPNEWISSISSQYQMKYLHKFIHHLLEGLVKLQDAHIVHHDIKNDNILVRKSGNPVMIDFGLSIDMSFIENHNDNDTTPSSIQIPSSIEHFIFYAPSYELWTPELQVLGYIFDNSIHKTKNKTSDSTHKPTHKSTHNSTHIDIETIPNVSLSRKQVNEIVKYSTKSFEALVESKFITRYQSNLTDTLDEYRRMDTRQLVKHCLQMWNTWDVYSVAQLLLELILSLHKRQLLYTNEEFNTLVEWILYGLHPTRRPDAVEWLDQFKLLTRNV